jgi:ribosomal protein L37AE/L43A
MKTASQTTPCPRCGKIDWRLGGLVMWMCRNCGQVVKLKAVPVPKGA